MLADLFHEKKKRALVADSPASYYSFYNFELKYFRWKSVLYRERHKVLVVPKCCTRDLWRPPSPLCHCCTLRKRGECTGQSPMLLCPCPRLLHKIWKSPKCRWYCCYHTCYHRKLCFLRAFFKSLARNDLIVIFHFFSSTEPSLRASTPTSRHELLT